MASNFVGVCMCHTLKRIGVIAFCAALSQAFKDGEVRFLICTDVGARGLDISGLPYVINMTLPDRAEDYIHRVGRVGESFQECFPKSSSFCKECRDKL